MRDLYEAIIGNKNLNYYLEKFEHFDQMNTILKSSWNWPAFIFSTTWALYRKMYGWFFILCGITILSNFIGKAGSPGLGGLIFVGVAVVFGIYANSLYHNNAKKKIALAQFSIKDEPKLLASLDRKGGVNTWVIYVAGLLPIIGILAAIAIPAYNDYTVRTHNKAIDSELDKVAENYDWSKVKVEPESCPKDYYVKQNRCVKVDWDKAFEKPTASVSTPQLPEGFEIDKNTSANLKPYEGDYNPIAVPAQPGIVQGSAFDTKDWKTRIAAWENANKEFLSDEKHKAALERWVAKYGKDSSIDNEKLIRLIDAHALVDFGYTANKVQ